MAQYCTSYCQKALYYLSFGNAQRRSLSFRSPLLRCIVFWVLCWVRDRENSYEAISGIVGEIDITYS